MERLNPVTPSPDADLPRRTSRRHLQVSEAVFQFLPLLHVQPPSDVALDPLGQLPVLHPAATHFCKPDIVLQRTQAASTSP